MPANPLKALNTAVHKLKDEMGHPPSPGQTPNSSSSPTSRDLTPPGGNTPTRRSFDLSRLAIGRSSDVNDPRHSMDSTRSGSKGSDLKHHLERIFGHHKDASATDLHSPVSTPSAAALDHKAATPSAADIKGHHSPGDVTPNQHKEAERRKAKEEARLAREQKHKEEAEAIELKHKEAYEQDPLKDHYGALPLAVRDRTATVQRDHAFDVGSMEEGKEVVLRARIHHIRHISAKVAFVILRQQMDTIQGVLAVGPDVSENLIRWACRLDLETVVLVHGLVQAPKAGQEEVKSTSVHNREVLIKKFYVLGTVTMKMPFHPEDIERGNAAEMPAKHITGSGAHTPSAAGGETASLADGASTVGTIEGSVVGTIPDEASFTPATPLLNRHTHAASKVGYGTRLENRLIDLRSDVSQAVFRIQAGIAKYFRRYLEDHGFIEIHTSKFQGGATESGASVFKVDYFGRTVFLAQSPQLGKQMAIASDMERVYEIGPVFRAENSNTHRHLTEFTGLDLEMAIENHYHEVIDMLDGALKAIFHGLQSEYRREIDTVRKLYPSEDLVFPEETVRLHFADGVQMLRDSGWTDDGHEIDFYEDFSTRTEKRLGELVKEKYGTDYYILDKFPASARPFYTMPDPDDPKRANACDFFIRGEEILSGGQRIHQAPFLEQRMRECGINPDIMKDYVDGFRQGCPPHGGGGIGLERVVFLFLKLGNIRWGTLFPRDPRSFPKAEQDALAKAVEEATSVLLGPTANTLEYEKLRHAGQKPPLPKLEDLIAAYGDSPNTSWLDPFWTVWHHEETGAAVGYAVSNKYALVWGRPLCDDSQIFEVGKAFHHYCKEKKLKPIWACVDEVTEQVLSERMGWRCVIAVAEQRVDPVTLAAEGGERSVRHKANRATKEGVTVQEKEGYLTDEEEEEIVQRLREWQQNRHGTQVYSAGLYPFVDKEHRRYFVARTKDNKICGLVVLAQLAREHGFQVKYSLDFPNAPPGTIELIVSTALQSLGRAGVHAATFGGSAPERLQPVGSDWGWRVKMLTKSYSVITKTFRLTDKASFREKFGTKADPQYVCYPSGGLGLNGIEAIMSILKSDKGGQTTIERVRGSGAATPNAAGSTPASAATPPSASHTPSSGSTHTPASH